jgi:predicted RNA-binding protein with RPS1 domain
MQEPWFYKDKPINNIEDLPDYEKVQGFVYMIQDTVTFKSYIGKKILRNTRKKKISQKVKKVTKTRKTYERTVKESDWKDYYGSSKVLLADIQ